MRTEAGEEVPETLGEYRRMCAAIGGEECPAVKFLDTKISDSPNGEDEIVHASLNTRLQKTNIFYGIYRNDEIVSVKWVDMIYQSTSNDGNDGTGGCWGGTPNPKLNIDFKHELTSPFIGWKAEEFRAFEAMCIEKMGLNDL